MTNLSLVNIMEIALTELSPSENKVIFISDENNSKLSIANTKIINLSSMIDLKTALELIDSAKYVGFTNSEDMYQSQLIDLLVCCEDITIVKISNNPIRCKIIYAKPTIGTTVSHGNYEYCYGCFYQDSTYGWKSPVSCQNGWGVKIIDNTQTDYECPLITINGYPVTNMVCLFYMNQAKTINLIDWDTSNVEYMEFMFCSSRATQIIGLNNFDTKKVKSMNHMFDNSNALELDVSSFQPILVENMENMFSYSSATCIIGLGSFHTPKLKKAKAMFTYSKSDILDVSSLDLSHVSNTSMMFACSFATKVYGIECLNVSNVKDMSSMFRGMYVTKLNLSNFNTINVESMAYMFSSSLITNIIGLGNLNTSNVNCFSGMFNKSLIRHLDLSGFVFSKTAKLNFILMDGKSKTVKVCDEETSHRIQESGCFPPKTKIYSE